MSWSQGGDGNREGMEKQHAQGASLIGRVQLNLANPQESQKQKGGNGRKRGAVGTELWKFLHIPQSQSKVRKIGAVASH